MKPWVGALFAILFPCAALAGEPVETVTVNASALVGVWKVIWPQSAAITLRGSKFGPMRDRFCRIDQEKSDLTVHCFAGGLVKDGTVSLDGEKIHLAWGSMMLRVVMDGVLQSGSEFTGSFGFKLSGVSHIDPDPSGGQKLHITAESQDKGGKASLLRAVLEGGLAAAAHDEAALRKNGFDAAALPKLGTLEAIAYLGQGPKFGSATELDFFSVYAVEFAGGERICGLHQNGDGKLDALLCM